MTMTHAMTAADYQAIQQPGLNKEQLTYSDIEPVLAHHKNNPLFHFEQIGQSLYGVPIHQITIGQGEKRILAWSQMHGDESTATAALLDLLNYIAADEQKGWRDSWLNNVTLRLIPMVNPDGAELGTRYTAQGIDMNRDAKTLQTPEGKILMNAAKAFKPHFGFNLHDQNRHYAVGEGFKPATISLLAPAFDHQKTVDEPRKRAMQLIGDMAELVEQEIPGHLGRYNDTYSERSFGDTFAGMGISTILVESGGYPADDTRQIARRVNAQLLVRMINSIVSDSYLNIPADRYNQIPFNRSGGVKDVVISNLQLTLQQQTASIDVAFDLDLKAAKRARIDDIGDLSIFGSYHQLDATGLNYQPGRAYSLRSVLQLTDDSYLELLKQGYTHFSGDEGLLRNNSQYPVLINPRGLPEESLQRRQSATFVLNNGTAIRYSVINGQIIDLQNGRVLNPLGT
ncbi:M14 family zinc carboxypeptidase [Chromatiaceae bacterium AAb-1]|nr:M14 family zinc carboxypeptidase [Chromatiaceae bacterium AAb-1]